MYKIINAHRVEIITVLGIDDSDTCRGHHRKFAAKIHASKCINSLRSSGWVLFSASLPFFFKCMWLWLAQEAGRLVNFNPLFVIQVNMCT